MIRYVVLLSLLKVLNLSMQFSLARCSFKNIRHGYVFF